MRDSILMRQENHERMRDESAKSGLYTKAAENDLIAIGLLVAYRIVQKEIEELADEHSKNEPV